MGLFFGKKEKNIIELFNKHLDAVDNTIEELVELIRNLDKDFQKVKELAEQVRNAETEADHIRRQAESEMYSGAFLPNFRGDLLGTIEAMDRIANKAETVADEIELQSMEVPEEILEDLEELILKSQVTYKAVKEAAKEMFEDFEKANEMILKTENYEHETDIIERSTIRKIFSLDISLAEKIQLKKLVHRIADISDTSEDVSDRIQIIIYKRKV
ncbi:TIGR00153 family protein [Marinitoga aeolica]|uniref:TIGR00153 family protein n=1 Tax=Marinitoga aeolica TaxID=2809031 RepID=A0ABY8PPE0_9BACT|nr:TIGR00153 family protein [Marinitoga aeolica]WGS64498.1 TIGR00153 family protein [Marinitoga aeolica]